MRFETLIYEQSDRYGLLRLNLPEQLNAMSPLMINELNDFFTTMPHHETRFIVLAGNGKCFGAGGDLKAMSAMSAPDAEVVSMQAHNAFDLIKAYPIPVVASVHGFAIGGGFELALACDMIFATEYAWFSLPELKYDMLPGGGGTVRYPLAVGKGRAFWDILTGNKVTAKQALQLGIVQSIIDNNDHVGETISILKKIVIPIEKEAIRQLKEIFASINTNNQAAFDNEARGFSQLLEQFAKQKIDTFINKKQNE